MMLPGIELAEQILKTDGVQAMQLVVFLVVLGWVLATWLNGRAVAQMSSTQHEMSHTNAQFIEADAKKTEVLQATVDELKSLREDFERVQQMNQQGQDLATQALRAHDEKVDERVKAILDYMSMVTETQTQAMQRAVTGLVDEAVLSFSASTLEALKPALDVLLEIKASIGAINALQQGQIDLLKQQQHEQMALLKVQHEAHLRLLESQLARAEHVILQSIQAETYTDENSV
jgi:hypothetical protein